MVGHILPLFLFFVLKSSLGAVHFVCKNPMGLGCKVFLRRSFAFVPGRHSTQECKIQIEPQDMGSRGSFLLGYHFLLLLKVSLKSDSSVRPHTPLTGSQASEDPTGTDGPSLLPPIPHRPRVLTRGKHAAFEMPDP